MTSSRGPQLRHRSLLVIAALVLAGVALVACEKVSDTPTFPERPPQAVDTWFFGVWGASSTDVYVVGQPGLIYHWDGSAWQREASPVDVALTDVWGDGEGTVYVTGHRGVILRKRGTGGWERMDSGTDQNLYSVGAHLLDATTGGTEVVLAAGQEGTLRQLAGSSWIDTGNEIYRRDASETVIDTLYRNQDIESLTCVGYYGIGGSDGIVLMDDFDTDWRLRRVRGGEGWVTDATGDDVLASNFIATDHGRMFQLREEVTGSYSWQERYSPAPGEIVYGIWADEQNSVYAVTDAGRVAVVTRLSGADTSLTLYQDGMVLFDVWGTSSDNIYAVGINGRILHYYDPEGGQDTEWFQEEVELPAGKSHAAPACDKFGRPIW